MVYNSAMIVRHMTVRMRWISAVLLTIVIGCMSVAMALPRDVYADDGSLSITLTPPLFQLTVGPGETWKSSIKIVNNNTYDVTYYAQLMNFAAEGEGGKSQFVPLVDGAYAEGTQHTESLARWITITKDPITVRRGESVDVPFTVTIPTDAEPGGHYAAILVGNQPAGGSAEGALVKVSSLVSSLLFVKISGDVHEGGRVREFRSDKALYDHPEASFMLRFENTGNVHLRPQGIITIKNMWGKERGSVAINQKGEFGNVLPGTIRRFEFVWKGEHSAFDMGRYSASVTLAYGDEGKQSTSAETYFWVVPVVPLAATLGTILAFALTLIWLIKRYVRRAIALEHMHTEEPLSAGAAPSPTPSVTPPRSAAASTLAPTYTIGTLMEPIREGVIDLRAVAHARKAAAAGVAMPTAAPAAPVSRDVPLTWGQFLVKYKLFFVFVALLTAACGSAWWYFDHVLEAQRAFEITEIEVK